MTQVTATLGAVLITPDDWRNMRRTLEALRAQTVRDRIELVLVGPSLDALDIPDAEVQGFAGVRRIAAEPTSMGALTAAGVRAATAPLVALTEDHCYPMPDWAERLIARHAADDYAVVGPTMLNANPRTAASWSQFYLEYAPHCAGAALGEMTFAPGHNSCYRRDALLAYEPNLERRLECETLMHWDMTGRRGWKVFVDPDVRTRHFNCSRFGPSLMFAYRFSRVFAAFRATTMRRGNRLILFALWPIIPLLRLRRIFPIMLRHRGPLHALRVLPGVTLNLYASAYGEAVGYWEGAGDTLPQCLDLEFHRDRFFRKGERLHPADPNATA